MKTPFMEDESQDEVPAHWHQSLFNALKGYGRRGNHDGEILYHGKDADLESAGQCVLKQCLIIDGVGSSNLKAEMTIQQYASVCEPRDYKSKKRDKSLRDQAQEIVTTWDDYPGEWTGSDYWNFYQPEFKISFEVKAHPDDEGFSWEKVASGLIKKLTKDERYKSFCANMAELNKILNTLKP